MRPEFTYRDVPAEAITNPADALVASMLIPAMAVGEDIEVDAPVSARLLKGVEKIVFINKEWYPKLHRTRVSAPANDEPLGQPTEVATYFSGGMDSFYTILRPREDPITMLFTITGFDLRFEKRLERVDDPELHAAFRRALRLGRLYRRLDPVIDLARRRRLRARVATLSGADRGVR